MIKTSGHNKTHYSDSFTCCASSTTLSAMLIFKKQMKHKVQILYRYFAHQQMHYLLTWLKSFKFTLKYTLISLLRVSVFNDHHQGALSVPN
jgi:hypothetical protein